MSKYQKIEWHSTMDSDVWAAYEEVWEEWSKYKSSGMTISDYVEYSIGGKIEVLEKILEKYILAKYYRAGEPLRTTMGDVISYHNKLDRQYGLQKGAL